MGIESNNEQLKFLNTPQPSNIIKALRTIALYREVALRTVVREALEQYVLGVGEGDHHNG